ncbi:hypothetical protein AQJ46_13605 [Streptomyces canus]|uniref:Uncharacterized protein n=1 Tax=Streptomyces canus TaxID=58343 RepID=A0A117R5P7_9ACTN|nr:MULTISPECIES: hypothetical protein [Streptomyces]KUN72479.1 hypothetical protein AQJ46_13605 [Streptomyces canus]MDI5910884.1 hypothetical protein [Streptomyces sp. 12257]
MVDTTPPSPTTPQPPTTPPPPAFPPSEVPTPPRRLRTSAIVLGSAAAVIAAIVTTGVVAVRSTNGDDKPAGVAASSVPDADAVSPVSPVSPVRAPDPEPTYVAVDADSFSIDLRTTARQCFGSAGCNVTVQPELTYLGSSGDLDPDAVYEITYEIHGDESGPVIQTAELTNQTSLSYRPSLISTASASSTELSVEITDIQQG